MARKTYSTEQIIVILRQMEVLCGQGRSAEEGSQAIQLGIRRKILYNYVNDYIVKITDITSQVKEIKQKLTDKSFDVSMLPIEKKYQQGY